MPAPNMSTSTSEVDVLSTGSPAFASSQRTPVATEYAIPTTTSGSSASTGERYTARSRSSTSAPVASRSVTSASLIAEL